MKGQLGKTPWIFDFSNCFRPEASAKAFAERLDGVGVEDESGACVELSASIDPEHPSEVVVTYHDYEPALTTEALMDDVVEFVEKAESECRTLK